MKRKIFVGLLGILMCLVLSGCGNSLEEEKDKLQETVNKYGFVSKETVFDTIDKFNVKLSDNDMHYFANNDYMISENDLYWYGIYEDITCYVKPVNFSNDIKKDITATVAIRYDKDSKNEKMAMDYIKYLINASNSEITDNEVNELMNEAKEKSSSGKTANNGKGISVGVLNTGEVIEYQIIRLYNE